jgi:hypothetical protein
MLGRITQSAARAHQLDRALLLPAAPTCSAGRRVRVALLVGWLGWRRRWRHLPRLHALDGPRDHRHAGAQDAIKLAALLTLLGARKAIPVPAGHHAHEHRAQSTAAQTDRALILDRSPAVAYEPNENAPAHASNRVRAARRKHRRELLPTDWTCAISEHSGTVSRQNRMAPFIHRARGQRSSACSVAQWRSMCSESWKSALRRCANRFVNGL